MDLVWIWFVLHEFIGTIAQDFPVQNRHANRLLWPICQHERCMPPQQSQVLPLRH